MAPEAVGENIDHQKREASERVATTPRHAAAQLAEDIAGVDLSLSIGRVGFEGLPKPAKGIRFRAHRGHIDSATFRLALTMDAISQQRVLARKTYVFPLRFTARVPVPRRMIRSEQMISRADLVFVEKVLGVEGERYVLDIDAAIGRIARRTLLPNRMIALRSISLPFVVRRGALVDVQTFLSGMRIEMRGEALEDGAVGDEIRVLNPRSKKILRAKVVGAGSVEVER